jgi:hypothetical protein
MQRDGLFKRRLGFVQVRPLVAVLERARTRPDTRTKDPGLIADGPSRCFCLRDLLAELFEKNWQIDPTPSYLANSDPALLGQEIEHGHGDLQLLARLLARERANHWSVGIID